MIALEIQVNGDGMLEGTDLDKITEAKSMVVGALPAGMESGKPSVSLALKMPDGSVALAQTSLALFLTAADALKAAHGDPRD